MLQVSLISSLSWVPPLTDPTPLHNLCRLSVLRSRPPNWKAVLAFKFLQGLPASSHTLKTGFWFAWCLACEYFSCCVPPPSEAGSRTGSLFHLPSYLWSSSPRALCASPVVQDGPWFQSRRAFLPKLSCCWILVQWRFPSISDFLSSVYLLSSCANIRTSVPCSATSLAWATVQSLQSLLN